MENLIEKYRQNSITLEELKVLREKINGMTDAELSKYLVYDESAFEGESLEDRLNTIKAHIDKRIQDSEKRKSQIVIPRWVGIAASIFVPLLIISVFFLVYRYQNFNSTFSYNTVKTAEFNDTKLILADGTNVNLRRNSTIVYPSYFSRQGRKVEFEGVAIFDVTHNEKEPFTITTTAVDVTVKGTTFAINARESAEYTQVSLFDGIVELTSNLTQERVTMTEGTIAILNNRNGEIMLHKMNSNAHVDWLKDEIQFQNIAPDSLINEIENYYNIDLPPALKESINGNFTGTLPLDNLPLTLEVLEKVYTNREKEAVSKKI